MPRIQGVNVAMLTPFDENGEVLWSSVDRMIGFLLDKRVNGVFPASSTGEFVKLTLDQRKRLVDRVAHKATGGLQLLAGCGAATIQQALELARHAHSAGCDAVIVCPPYYYPLSGDEIAVFFQKICDSSPLPVVLYHIPVFTSAIPLEVLAEACRHPNVTAVKESSGDIAFLGELAGRLKGAPVNVLVGPDELLYPALNLGATGCISGCSGIFPELVLQLFSFFEAGQDDEARRTQSTLSELLAEMLSVPYPYGLKAAMEVRGIEMGAPSELFTADMLHRYAALKTRIAARLVPGYLPQDS